MKMKPQNGAIKLVNTYIGRGDFDTSDVRVDNGRVVANGFDKHVINIDRFESLHQVTAPLLRGVASIENAHLSTCRKPPDHVIQTSIGNL